MPVPHDTGPAGPQGAAFSAARPHIARVYDYLLGGKENFAADRAVADQILASLPAVQVGVRAQRDLLGRVVRYLVGEAGIRQLLDVGSGLPTADNVHEIAHRIDAGTRVVYLDNDPVVLTHAQALLADDEVTFAARGDLRDPAAILAQPKVRARLDWDQPIGLLLCGILHYVLDDEDPAGAVGTLYDALPAGSYVFIHHMLDSEAPASARLQTAMQKGLGRTQFRTHRQITGLFGGLELVEPGVVQCPNGAQILARPGSATIPSSGWRLRAWPERRDAGPFGLQIWQATGPAFSGPGFSGPAPSGRSAR